MDTINVPGFLTKTLEIETSAGTKTYNLSTNKFIGLPKNALILGFTHRVVSANTFAPSGRNLVSASVFNGSFLSVQTEFGGVSFIKNTPLVNFVKPAVSPFSGNPPTTNNGSISIKPILNKDVDWESSTISVADSVTVNNGESFELVVYYMPPASRIKPKVTFQKYASGANLLGVNVAPLDVIFEDGTFEYNLSFRSSVGITDKSTLVGFKMLTNPNIINRLGNTFGTQELEAAFLTLQSGNTILLNEFPFSSGATPPFPIGMDYIPLPPTEVGLIDWQSSKLKLTNPALALANKYLQILLYYV